MHKAFVQALTVCLSLGWTAMANGQPQAPAADLDSVTAAVPLLQEQAKVRVSLIRTSGVESLESLMVEGGSWSKTAAVNHVAVLVEHGGEHFLFDTGLGRQIDAQFQQDMPMLYRPLFSYEQVVPARDQLDEAGISIPRIVLSHAHWDHASALVDFPDAEVWTTTDELSFMQKAKPPAVFPSQVHVEGIQWRPLTWSRQPFRGYERSLDVYNDGSVVLVPLDGHTPGGIGMFTTLSSGRQLFFIGDIAWRLRGVQERAPKFWLARRLVDADADETLREVARIADVQEQDPALTIVPAHDRSVHDQLGYFPHWIE